MPNFSLSSTIKLATCAKPLQDLFNEVIKHVNCVIAVGHRTEQDQDAAVASGKSLKAWPTSLHNRVPSAAVDVAPVPVDWSDIEAFQRFAVIVKATALELGIKVRWGGDFKHLKDYDHWELIDEGQEQ